MNNQRKIWVLLSLALILLGLGMIFSHLWHPYQLVVDGQPLQVRTIAFSLRGLLRQLNYELQPEDRASIDPDAFSFNLPERMYLERARLVEITVGSEKLTLRSPERLPANLLQAAGIRLFPGDLLTQNGQALDPNQALPIGAEASLRFLPAREIILEMDGQTRTIYTQQDRLADALLEAGIHLQPEDRLSAEPDTLLGAQNTFSLDLARSLTVTIGKETLVGLSAARTVGEALADLGLAPQYLDRTVPPEDDPLPPDGQITFIQGS